MYISYAKHTGSIAFGSLLHVLVTVIRIIVDTIVKASEVNNDNAAVRCI